MAKKSTDVLGRYLIEWNYDRWERIKRHPEYRELWEGLQEAEGRLQEKKNKHQALCDRLGFYTTRFFCLASEKLRSRSPELFLAPLPLSVSKRGIKNIEPQLRDIETEIGIIEREIATIQEEIRTKFGIKHPLDPYQEYPKELFITTPIFVKPPVNVTVIPANPSPLKVGEGIEGEDKDWEEDSFWKENVPFLNELGENKSATLDINRGNNITLDQLLYQIEGEIERFRPHRHKQKKEFPIKKFPKEKGVKAITRCEQGEDGHLILEINVNVKPENELLNQIKKALKKHFKSPGIRFRDHRLCYQVWDIREQRKTYGEIAREVLGKSSPRAIEQVKKMFYRAYELIYGEKYNHEVFRREALPSNAQRTCEGCLDKPTCQALCPSVLASLNQVTGYQREVPYDPAILDRVPEKLHRKTPLKTIY